MNEPVVPQRAFELLKRVGGKVVAVDTPEIPKVPLPDIPASIDTNKPVADYLVEPQSTNKTETGNTSTEPKNLSVPKEVLADLDPDDDIDKLVEPNEKVAKNFSRVRSHAKYLNKTNKELVAEKETLSKKIADYETGIVAPEIIENLNKRVSELEPFEKMYNLKATPAYIEKITKPIQQEQEKVFELAEDAGITNEVLQEVFGASAVEQNRILSQNGVDPATALEIRTSLKFIKDRQKAGWELEQEPVKAFGELQAESLRIQEEARQKSYDGIIYTSKDAWTESLGHLQDDNRFKYLQWIEGDTEHNEKYARVLRTKAGQEYGKMVRMIAEAGATNLPKELGVALARANQLAHLSGVLVHENESLYAEIAELKNSIKARNGRDRPGLNGSGSGSSSSNGNGSYSSPTGNRAEDAGQRVLNRVSGK